ncbi:DYL1-like protein [Mya arenaria]|uniref:Dynein light chain n=1 Tax=Mya arenaria TaxID=6604 RepID=A0ABY7DYG6_MYAAR|nr:DYL1-like protein [Mya arenaria]
MSGQIATIDSLIFINNDRSKWRAFRYNYTETPVQPNERLGVANMGERKAVIKNADMSEEMQQDAVDCATQALEKYNIEKDIAAYIKKEFDKKYNPTWHAIVGRNFGSYVTHETKHFIYFYLGQVAILLFKSG